MSAVRGIKTKTLVREVYRRREALAEERDKLAARVNHLDAEIEDIDQMFSEQGGRVADARPEPKTPANGKAAAPARNMLPPRQGATVIAGVLEKAKRPLNADEVFDYLINEFDGEGYARLRKLIHRTLHSLVRRGEVKRLGIRGHYKYRLR